MKYVRYILLLALTALLIGGTFWARNKSRDEVCTEVRVEVVNDDGTSFVTPAGVIEELERKHIILKGKPVWQINVENVEKAIAQSQYIENVECMFVNGGCLKIKVSQIMPVMRIFDGDQSYYVNKDGKRMTAVATFNADVPVVEGHFTKAYSPLRLLPMIQYVESDSALKSLVTMYCVKDTNNIIIIPSVEGHVVNMGNCKGYESKFRKLKLFYNKVMPVKGWLYYDTISVKWDYQVVATRRDKVVEVVQQYDPEEDEIADNASTMKVTTTNNAPAKNPEENKPAATKPDAGKTEKPQQEQKKDKKNN
ncbi:MAG: hypothetical protein IKT03_05370 [Muribaculaceae bacterium]|nr:hypothetical protein [Muribaculaceae bacterium]